MVKKGDIIRLRVNFSDGTGSKTRPCIAIAKHKSDWNFLEASGQEYLKDDKYCFLLDKDRYSLKKASYVKIWKIHTVDDSRLPYNPLILDSLQSDDLQKILEKLNVYFCE